MCQYGPDQSNKLSMFDSNDGSTSPNSPQDIRGIDCTIRVF